MLNISVNSQITSQTKNPCCVGVSKMSKEMLCHMLEALVSINAAPGGDLLRLTGGNNTKNSPNCENRETRNEEKWEKWVWNFHCPKLSLHTDAQLSQCSWPTDKWEKIVQFELVVSSRSAAFQINERLPQVWQEIFLKHSWETGPYHGKPLAMPSIRQARHYSRGDLAVPLLPGFLFLHSPSQPPLPPMACTSFFFPNPHLKRQCSGSHIINVFLRLVLVWKQKQQLREGWIWMRCEGWRERESKLLTGVYEAESNTYSGCLDFDSPFVVRLLRFHFHVFARACLNVSVSDAVCQRTRRSLSIYVSVPAARAGPLSFAHPLWPVGP